MKFKYSISKELQSFDSKILFRQIDFKNLSCFKAGMVDQPAVRSQPDNTEVIFDLDGNILWKQKSEAIASRPSQKQ